MGNEIWVVRTWFWAILEMYEELFLYYYRGSKGKRLERIWSGLALSWYVLVDSLWYEFVYDQYKLCTYFE